jgi:hypothetical protein
VPSRRRRGARSQLGRGSYSLSRPKSSQAITMIGFLIGVLEIF